MKKDISSLIVDQGTPIKRAWKKLDDNGSRILFVTDEVGCLKGSVTDGDIRRWILADHAISQPVSDVMNNQPVTGSDSESNEALHIKAMNAGVECIPVINDDGKILKVVFRNDWIANGAQQKRSVKLDVPAVIMAGGVGSRLDPYTRVLPKPLIPINDKTMIEMIMDEFGHHGVNRFFISLNYKASMIRAYFAEISHEYDLHFFQEPSPMGTAGSLTLIKNELPETFFMSNCDIHVNTDYAEVLAFHRSHGYYLTMVCSMKHYQIPYGIVRLRQGGHFVSIEEKPEMDFLVNTGLYVVDRRALAYLPGSGIFHITHLIDALDAAGMPMGVFPISDTAWTDVGQLKEYQDGIAKLSK
jgi:dTDP-glucose pyrophosphorylase